jgi:hypothetical protein
LNKELNRTIEQQISKLSREERRRLYRRTSELRRHPDLDQLIADHPTETRTFLWPRRRGISTREIARRLVLEEGIGENFKN